MKFAKTKDGKLHRIFSDNVFDENMDLIEESQWLDSHGNYNIETANTETYHYSDILVTDQNISAIKKGYFK